MIMVHFGAQIVSKDWVRGVKSTNARKDQFDDNADYVESERD